MNNCWNSTIFAGVGSLRGVADLVKGETEEWERRNSEREIRLIDRITEWMRTRNKREGGPSSIETQLVSKPIASIAAVIKETVSGATRLPYTQVTVFSQLTIDMSIDPAYVQSAHRSESLGNKLFSNRTGQAPHFLLACNWKSSATVSPSNNKYDQYSMP